MNRIRGRIKPPVKRCAGQETEDPVSVLTFSTVSSIQYRGEMVCLFLCDVQEQAAESVKAFLFSFSFIL